MKASLLVVFLPRWFHPLLSTLYRPSSLPRQRHVANARDDDAAKNNPLLIHHSLTVSPLPLDATFTDRHCHENDITVVCSQEGHNFRDIGSPFSSNALTFENLYFTIR